MKADRSHTHHKLIDMGMNQKQAVATLYMVAGVLGLFAVMIVTSGYLKVILSIVALIATAYTVARIARYPHEHHKKEQEEQHREQPSPGSTPVKEEKEESLPAQSESTTGEKKEP